MFGSFKRARTIVKQGERINELELKIYKLKKALEKAVSYEIDIRTILKNSDENKENYFETIEKIKKRTGVWIQRKKPVLKTYTYMNLLIRY